MDDEPGPLNDAVGQHDDINPILTKFENLGKSISDSIAKIEKETSTTKKKGEAMESVIKVIDQTKGALESYLKSVQTGTHEHTIATSSLAQVNASMAKMKIEMIGISSANAKFEDSVKGASSAMETIDGAIDSFGKVLSITTGEALGTALRQSAVGAVDKAMLGITALQPELAPLTLGLSAAAHAANAIVSAADAQTVAMRGTARAVLEAGGSMKEADLTVGSLSDQILRVGNAYNLTDEQTSAMTKSFADAGVRADRFGQSTALAARMATANGLELMTTTKLVGQLQAQYGLSGKELDAAVSTFTDGIHKSGIGAGLFIKEAQSVADSLRALGGNAEDAAVITTHFGTELKKGIVSAQQVANANSLQAGSMEDALAKSVILSQLPDFAAALGIKPGMSIDQKMLAAADADKNKKFVDLGGSVAAAFEYAKTHAAPGTQIPMFEQMAKTLGANFSSPALVSMFKDLEKGIKPQTPKSAEETARTEQERANDVLAKLSTSGEKLAGSVHEMGMATLKIDHETSARKEFVDKFGAAVNVFAGVVTNRPGTTGATVNSAAKVALEGSLAMSGMMNPMKAFGDMRDLITELRSSRKPGAAGGAGAGMVSVKMGDTHISVSGHDKAAVEKAIDEAHAASKKDIMSELEVAWNRMVHSQ